MRENRAICKSQLQQLCGIMSCFPWRWNLLFIFCLISVQAQSQPSSLHLVVLVPETNSPPEVELQEQIQPLANEGVGVVQEEEWEDPPPPGKLRVQTSQQGPNNPIAIINWEPPQIGPGTSGQPPTPTGYKLTLEPFPVSEEDAEFANLHHSGGGRDGRTWEAEFPPTTTFLTDEETTLFTTDKTYSLSPGRSYGIRVQSLFQDRLSPPLFANFTIRPDPPDRFVVWYRNETCFLVLWQPPSHGVFQRYKAELSPRESPISTLYVTRWEYQFGGVRPGFCSLTPGKAYNISVSTLVDSGEGPGPDEGGWVESSPVVKEYRTMPLPVSNVTVSILQFPGNASNILVEWEPPSLTQGEHDGFNVYIKRSEWGKPSQKFIPLGKPPRAVLNDDGLIEGQEYQVVVKTVAGKVSSTPVIKTFTYFLNPGQEVDETVLQPEVVDNFHLES